MFSKLSIKRPVTTIMVIMMVAMAGIISYTGLPLALMPTIDIPIALVMTTYTGAGPEEIEKLVTEPIEEALSSISNVDKITSSSSVGSSMVMIQFVDGTDVDMAAIDMREKIDMVKRSLPTDADDPMVLKMDMNAQSILIGVVSDRLDLEELNNLLEDNVVNKLKRIEGVSAVTLTGGDENEIEIVVKPEKLQGYGISTSQIAQVLAAENTNKPSGQISQGETKLQIRTLGEFKNIEEIKELPITTPSGAVIHIKDVATVTETNKDKESYVLMNGKEGIVISVDKQSTANIVDVSNKLNKEIAKISKAYPEIDIQLVSDTADYIKTSIDNVTSTAFQSAVVAIIVLFIFLREVKTSLIIGISIPTSILATFALMWMKGMTMNIISMGGITIGIGMLVDNSVVVLENIFKYWKNGMEPKRAAEVGAGEVAMAVTASTLTTIGVFFPLMFVKGTVGQMMQDLSYTICFSLLASLVVSLTFVPMACSKLLNREETKIKKGKKRLLTKFLDAWGRGLDNLDKAYRKALVWSLKNKKKVVAFVIVAFIASLATLPIVGLDLMPTMDEGSASISIEMPKGTELAETQKMVDEIWSRIEDIEEKELMYGMVGQGMMSMGTDIATIYINMVDKEFRSRSTDEIVEDIKLRLADLAGAEITVSGSSNAMGSYGGAGISVNLNGDDTDTLRDISKDVMKMIDEIEGTSDITSSSQDSIPEANVVINRAKAANYGISTSSIASAVNTAVTGSIATQYKVDGTEIDVRIRYDKDSINFINDLKNVSITASNGISIPITEIADISIGDSAVSIARENQVKYITVSANVTGVDTMTVQKELTAKLDNYIFPDGYNYSFSGTMEMMTESFTSLGIVLIVAILLVYMIMASQFESFIYPFIVMFSMPIAITGGILGLLVTGKTITTTSFMGFIMLVGMVVNNAIVLVDYANQLIDNKKLSCFDALVEAGPNRLRPILMTTLTTVVGLVPMAMGTAEGMEMQQPLAIAVIFGLTISTLVTLIFIPVLYLLVDKYRSKNRKKKNKKKGKESLKDMIDASV